MVRVLSCVFGLMLLTAACASSEEPDRHLTGDPAGVLCRESAYVHGYMHGYENGFRVGDLEIHMGRRSRAVSEVKEYQRASGYRSRYGNQSYFRLGYQQGFRAAYDDAQRGIAFRGISQLQQAAQGRGLQGERNNVDAAISAGYDAGYGAALRDPRPDQSFQYASGHCPANHRGAGYCDGYVRGFRLGYADGFVSQTSRRMETAQAGMSGTH